MAIATRQRDQSHENDPALENVRTIASLERRALRELSWSDRLSDQISRFAGSLMFVFAHAALFLMWAGWNALAPADWRFDPYPYGLLTFVVSLEGVLIATFVLITQNRMSQQAEARSQLHLQVDLLTEQELTMVLRTLRRIAERLDIAPDSDETARAQKLTEETNVFELMKVLEREFRKHRTPE